MSLEVINDVTCSALHYRCNGLRW